MTELRALVIEDNESIARINRTLLEREGFAVDVANTAADAGTLVRTNEYAMITLDMVLPDGPGLAVLAMIRERNERTPVLVVSGIGDVDSTISALDAGADDYLLKPYRPGELTARVRALLRRGRFLESPRIECGNVVLERMERSATVAGQPITLTTKEFALLEYFVINREKTVARADLLKKVWRFDFDPGTNMVDVNVSRLREKLVNLGCTCRVKAERGIGYVFTELAPPSCM